MAARRSGRTDTGRQPDHTFLLFTLVCAPFTAHCARHLVYLFGMVGRSVNTQWTGDGTVLTLSLLTCSKHAAVLLCPQFYFSTYIPLECRCRRQFLQLSECPLALPGYMLAVRRAQHMLLPTMCASSVYAALGNH